MTVEGYWALSGISERVAKCKAFVRLKNIPFIQYPTTFLTDTGSDRTFLSWTFFCRLDPSLTYSDETEYVAQTPAGPLICHELKGELRLKGEYSNDVIVSLDFLIPKPGQGLGLNENILGRDVTTLTCLMLDDHNDAVMIDFHDDLLK